MGSMSDPAPASRFSRKSVLLLGILALGLLGAAAWVALPGRGQQSAAAPECRASESAAQRLARFARGEVAAVVTSKNPARPPVIALRWNPDTGELYRLSDSEDPFLRTAMATLLDTPDVTSRSKLRWS